MTLPTISIVTPSFNQGEYIAAAIDSVIGQRVNNVELIVMDGGSRDQTINILRRYESRLPLRWISQPDQGIYDALNRAISLAEGDWIGWLNCDDLYPRGTLQRVNDAISANDVQAVCGDAQLFRTDAVLRRTILKEFRHYRGDKFASTPENLNITHLNACFFRKDLMARVGAFDARFRIAGDRDYMLRLMRIAPASCHIGAVACLYRTHPGSLTMAEFDSKKETTIPGCGPRLSKELLTICREHLLHPDTPEPSRRWCDRMLLYLTARDAAHLTLSGSLPEALAVARTRSPVRFSWVVAFAIGLARETISRLRRRCRAKADNTPSLSR